jgi:choline kinase
MDERLSNYDVLVLCGGYGTRLKGIIPAGLPKCLADVNGKPFLYYQLDYLKRQGFRKIVLCTGYGSSLVQQATYNWADRQRCLFSDEGTPKGTMNAVRTAILSLAKCGLTNEFFIVNGDTYLDTDLEKLAAPVSEKIIFGVSPQFQPVGVYKASASFFLLNDSESFHNLEDAIIHRPLSCTWRLVKEPFHDIGTPEGLAIFRALAKTL